MERRQRPHQGVHRVPLGFHRWAPAHAALADCYNLLDIWANLPTSETFPRAKAAAQKALQHRARMNSLAAKGEWKAELEKQAKAA